MKYKIPFDMCDNLLCYHGKQVIYLNSYDKFLKEGVRAVSGENISFKDIKFDIYPPNEIFNLYKVVYEPILKDNYVFSSSVEYCGYQKGRSAINILVKSYHNNKKYPIFIKDWDSIVKNCSITKGLIENKNWTFIKRGANFGIKLAEF